MSSSSSQPFANLPVNNHINNFHCADSFALHEIGSNEKSTQTNWLIRWLCVRYGYKSYGLPDSPILKCIQNLAASLFTSNRTYMYVWTYNPNSLYFALTNKVKNRLKFFKHFYSWYSPVYLKDLVWVSTRYQTYNYTVCSPSKIALLHIFGKRKLLKNLFIHLPVCGVHVCPIFIQVCDSLFYRQTE